MEEAKQTTGVEYQRTVEVDGEEYKIIALMPSVSFRLSAKLMKLIGEPFAAMASASGNKDQITEALPKAVRSLMTNFNEEAVLTLVKALMLSCEVKGQMINEKIFETHFHGRMGTMGKVLFKIIEFQFQDFFQQIGQAISETSIEASKSA